MISFWGEHVHPIEGKEREESSRFILTPEHELINITQRESDPG
jgi:hypothetical protein